MRRRAFIIAGSLVAVGALGGVAWFVSRPPPDPAPVEDELDVQVAELAPGSDLPELWGADALGATHCDVEQIGRRVRYDFDDDARLVRRRVWRRSPEDTADAEPRPWEVTRWSYGTDGLEVQLRSASRALAAEDPYAEPSPEREWHLTEARVTHAARDEWLHQRTVSGDDSVHERLFRLEGGQVVLRSPLRVDDAVPTSDHCLFDPEGRPLRFRDAAGEETRWIYEGGRLASVEQHPSTGAPPTVLPATVLLDRHRGDCVEVVFEACSAVLQALPGHPLPRGILPGPG